jgi:hypothetical protein
MYFGLMIGQDMLLIYSKPATTRLKYIARLLLGDLFGIETEFTENEEEFLSYAGPRINYSAQELASGLQILPAPLLFEKGVFDHRVEVEKNGMKVFLYPSPKGGFPFDVFAASFYLVTRYEEYESSKKDKYGRYNLSQSVAKTHGFLDQPVVNSWAEILALRLRGLYPALALKPSAYRFIPTIDVDHAYAYKGRGLGRTLGGIGRSLSGAKFGKIAERIMVLNGLMEDPYDTFDYIRDFHSRLGILPWFFILFADYGGKDNNVSLNRKSFLNMLAGLADEATLGIHPSLSSNRSPKRLETEINGLASATGREIRSSRQHFLKFSFPRTFRHLITFGITDDFSMGYASDIGFRAGIANPFRFFDLYRNEVTPLTIHPVTAMDVTFRDYLRLTPEKSTEKIKQLADVVRSVNGEFVSLWHNESLSDKGRWSGWRKVFEETTAYAAGIKG